MRYPEIKTDLLFTAEKPFSSTYLDTFLVKDNDVLNIDIQISEVDRPTEYPRGEWIASSSFINLYVTDSFVDNHYRQQTKDFLLFTQRFKDFIRPIASISNSLEKSGQIKLTRPYAAFSTFYKTKDNFILHFIFKINGNEDIYTNALIAVFDLIIQYNSEDLNKVKTSIRETYSQSNKIKYLLYVENGWSVLNPLIEVCREINDKYRKDADIRIKKPSIIMHKNDFRKYILLDTNWVLKSDNLETFIVQPNDVAIYSSISDKNLIRAEKFYSENITPRYKYHSGSFPDLKIQSEYYDYFELIITATIFAYTALEAFANTCIPNRYKYSTENNGIQTIYSKVAIEKKFPLRDKFKNVLKEVLNTSDPTKESWWNSFILLENLRDEIIHTKQLISEERYSKLLSYDTFKVIKSHKDIINYYGSYIFENMKELLDEFPYNFGYDDIFPGMTDEKGYERSYKVLHGIQDDEK